MLSLWGEACKETDFLEHLSVVNLAIAGYDGNIGKFFYHVGTVQCYCFPAKVVIKTIYGCFLLAFCPVLAFFC